MNKMSSAQMSQMRDMADNDNVDPWAAARAFEAFARDRQDDAAFAPFVAEARRQARKMRRDAMRAAR